MLWIPDDFRRILHRATMVVLEDGPYYCDVGYGGPGPRYPVKLEDGLHTEKNGTFRVTMEPQDTNGEILMERKQDGEYRPLMSFTLHPAQDVDFEVLNYYCSTSPDMWLTQKTAVSISTPTGSVALTGDTLTIQKEDGSIESRICDSPETEKTWLKTYFGL